MLTEEQVYQANIELMIRCGVVGKAFLEAPLNVQKELCYIMNKSGTEEELQESNRIVDEWVEKHKAADKAVL